jgi:drug/metabolite transporter (DMT)-like permease
VKYEISIVLIVGILWATVGIIYSRVARRGEDFVSFISFNSLLTTVSAWIIIPRHDLLIAQPITSHLPLLSVMLLAGLFSSFGMTAMHHSMRRGHHGATWTIGQSALIFPFALGIGIWGDSVKIINVCGFLTILTGIVLLGMVATENRESAKPSAGGWLSVALLSLLLLGIGQTLTTIPSRWLDWQDTARMRVPLLLTGSMIGYFTLMIGLRRQFRIRAWREGIILCAIGLLSQLLLFWALDVFAASSRSALVYPVAIGTCTTAFAIYSMVYLKEEATVFHVLGIGLGCIGVVFVSLK